RITTIHYDIGEVVNVGEIILEIDDGKEKMMQQNVPEPLQDLDRDEKVGEVEKKEVVKQSVPSTAVLAAPYTRKIAREHQIDIEKLKGTGYDGRVLEKDIYAYLGAQENGEIENKDNQTSLKTLPFKGIRKQIAKNMSNSVRTIPHVTHYEEVDVT